MKNIKKLFGLLFAFVIALVQVNAAGNGSGWMNAKGWSAFIYRGAGQKTKELAGCLTKAAEKEGIRVRYEYPGVPYWTSGFYICKNTKPSTVLTENLFVFR